MPTVPDFTALLAAASDGSPEAVERLAPIVYDELREMAAGLMGGERDRVTLSPTVLVHEAWLRLAGPRESTWKSRRHFFGAAAWSMRRILVDHARRRRRGGARSDVEPHDLEAPLGWTWEGIDRLDQVLGELSRHDPRKHEVVMLRYFSGLTVEQTAEVMDISPRTVKREWRFARAWLLSRLGPEPDAA